MCCIEWCNTSQYVRYRLISKIMMFKVGVKFRCHPIPRVKARAPLASYRRLRQHRRCCRIHCDTAPGFALRVNVNKHFSRNTVENAHIFIGTSRKSTNTQPTGIKGTNKLLPYRECRATELCFPSNNVPWIIENQDWRSWNNVSRVLVVE